MVDPHRGGRIAEPALDAAALGRRARDTAALQHQRLESIAAGGLARVPRRQIAVDPRGDCREHPPGVERRERGLRRLEQRIGRGRRLVDGRRAPRRQAGGERGRGRLGALRVVRPVIDRAVARAEQPQLPVARRVPAAEHCHERRAIRGQMPRRHLEARPGAAAVAAELFRARHRAADAVAHDDDDAFEFVLSRRRRLCRREGRGDQREAGRQRGYPHQNLALTPAMNVRP